MILGKTNIDKSEWVEVVEWNEKWSPPFTCYPVSRQCPQKKTLIEKKIQNCTICIINDQLFIRKRI